MSGDDDDHARRQVECRQTGTSDVVCAADVYKRLVCQTRSVKLHSSLDRQAMQSTQYQTDVISDHDAVCW